MLVVNDLANIINDTIAAKDAHGNLISTTPVMIAYAKAVINTYKAGLIANASGTVNGSGTPGGPLSGGISVGGLISNLQPSTWEGYTSAGIPGGNPSSLIGEATGSTGYLTSSSIVTFASGTITGSCTATPVNPGILAGGTGANGTVTGLTGSSWAEALTSVFPTSDITLMTKIYNAISNYLISNASASYASGSVVGTFSAGGGPLIAGTGIGGTLN